MSDLDWGADKRADWAHRRGADIYEARMGHHARQTDAEVYGEYLEGESGRLLDLPCGTGRFLRMIEDERERFEPVGADYSPNMLSVAQHTTSSPLVRCDGFRLPFLPQCFDTVLCVRLVFHYDALPSFASEFRRILKVNGTLIFDTLNRFSLRHILSHPFNMFRPTRGKQLWFASFHQVEAILADCGFEVERRESRYILPTRAYRFLPDPVTRLLATAEPALPESRRVLTYWKARKV